jgi:Ca2+-binding EF-hand superfamily protein
MEVAATMRELDSDNSGEIEFEEFYRWFSSSKNVAERLALAKVH